MMAGMRGSVLVVDDDPAFRRLAQHMLAAFGLGFAGEADTVAAAISAAGALRPDAVLLDVGLPDVAASHSPASLWSCPGARVSC